MDEVALKKRECELEKEAVGLGQGRYYASLAKRGEEAGKPGQMLIRRMIPPLAVQIEQWVADAHAGKAARNAGLALFLSQFDPYDVAFITARFIVGTFREGGAKSKLTTAATSLARALEEASMSSLLKDADPKAWKRLQTKIERCPYPNKRYILTRKAMGKAQVRRISWSKADKLRLGAHLIALSEGTSGTFSIEARYMGDRTTINFIVPHQETVDALRAANEKCALNSPWYLPMVVPPLEWKGLRDGGYYDIRGLRRWIVNSKHLDKDYTAALREAHAPKLYEAVNAVQATPWRINRDVHRVMKQAWEGGINVGKLPLADDLPIPSCPWGDPKDPPRGEDGKPTAAAKAHYAEVGRTHEANDKMRSKRLSMQSKLLLAAKFEEYDAIYFPHCVDFRGRLYPVPPTMNPQADDTGRALLTFSRTKKLGAEGAWYLAIHGANTFGYDKATFDERVKWVEERQQQIAECAEDPLANRWWSEADKPFTFLAFCFEWTRLMDWLGDGHAVADFESSLPVSWDGSCNGLQNFSAMLRDEIGGAATNLIPSERPADIYQRVADVASAQVERDAANGEVNAVYWKGKVDRSIAKRPTMTLPYGSGAYGFRDQLRAELAKRKLEDGKPYVKGDEFLCSLYLANVLHKALTEVVVAACSAMGWLKEASRIVAGDGKPVRWTAPTGFIVQQEYREQLGQRVECVVGGRTFQMLLQIDGDKIDRRKQAQGISPNFVHSLDAAHLMQTVSMCMAEGIEDFAMVHDSYGTHAASAGLMHKLLRRAFVEQYGSAHILADLREELMAQVPEKHRAEMPDVPAMGDLDLSAVEDSDYFFA